MRAAPVVSPDALPQSRLGGTRAAGVWGSQLQPEIVSNIDDLGGRWPFRSPSTPPWQATEAASAQTYTRLRRLGI
ncbi:MAG: hypothetical protein ACYCTZ_12510 [Candidatus Dormibacteria bacterium]